MSGEQKLKEGDEIAQQLEEQNNAELLFFSDKEPGLQAEGRRFYRNKGQCLGGIYPCQSSNGGERAGRVYGCHP